MLLAPRAAVEVAIENLNILTTSLQRRNGNPTEIRLQGRFQLTEIANCLEPETVKPDDVPQLAAFAGAFLRDPLQRDELLMQRLESIFVDHLSSAQVTARSASSIVEATTLLHTKGCAVLPWGNVLHQAVQKGTEIYMETETPQRSARQGIAFLRGTDLICGHTTTAPLPRIGGARALLPIKSRDWMEAKIQRCRVRPLLTTLKDFKLSQMDAAMCVETICECGFYDETILNNCCVSMWDRSRTMDKRHLTKLFYHLGTVVHRHTVLPSVVKFVNVNQLRKQELMEFVRGAALLRYRLDEQEEALRGACWKFGKNPEGQTVEWFAELSFMLALSEVLQPKFFLFLCRTQFSHRLNELKPEDVLRIMFAAQLTERRADSEPEVRASWSEVVQGRFLPKLKKHAREVLKFSTIQQALFDEAATPRE